MKRTDGLRFLQLVAVILILFAAGRTFAQTAPKILKKDDLLFRKEVYTNKKGDKMPYRLFVPPDYDATKTYPLIFWFHGGEGRGFDNEGQITGANELGTHIWTTKENQSQFPAFVLAPQCPYDSNWGDPDMNDINPHMQLALDILAAVQKKYPIDASRIFLVGQSMGGLGAWALLQSFPEKWAAALVLCSFDNLSNIAGVARVPLWIFQGDADLSVPLNLVQGMVKQLKKAGGQPRYSEYHKVGHEVWVKAFAEPDLVSWLAAQKRAN